MCEIIWCTVGGKCFTDYLLTCMIKNTRLFVKLEFYGILLTVAPDPNIFRVITIREPKVHSGATVKERRLVSLTLYTIQIHRSTSLPKFSPRECSRACEQQNMCVLAKPWHSDVYMCVCPGWTRDLVKKPSV